MKLSVISPCDKGAPWIGAALKSAAAQTLAPHEIICIDDGSTDETVAAIKATGVAANLLLTPHVNAAAARNTGIAAATGDWIAFLDADDLWYPGHLAQIKGLLRNSGDDAYLSLCDVLNEHGGVVPQPNPWRIKEPTRGLPAERFLTECEALKAFALCGCAIKRTALVKAGAFNPAMLRRHDFEMWLRVLQGRTWSFHPVQTSGACTDRPGRSSAATVEC